MQTLLYTKRRVGRGVVGEITDLCLYSVNLQLHAEVHNSSKKGHSNGKGVNFLACLRDTCAKLQSELEDCENHEELIENKLRDITAGKGRRRLTTFPI